MGKGSRDKHRGYLSKDNKEDLGSIPGNLIPKQLYTDILITGAHSRDFNGILFDVAVHYTREAGNRLLHNGMDLMEQQLSAQQKTRLKRIRASFVFFYLVLNPLFLAIIAIYLDKTTLTSDIDKIAIGIYSIIWYGFGVMVFIYPMFKRWLKKITTPYKPVSTDELIQKTWDDYRKEKEQKKQ